MTGPGAAPEHREPARGLRQGGKAAPQPRHRSSPPSPAPVAVHCGQTAPRHTPAPRRTVPGTVASRQACTGHVEAFSQRRRRQALGLSAAAVADLHSTERNRRSPRAPTAQHEERAEVPQPPAPVGHRCCPPGPCQFAIGCVPTRPSRQPHASAAVALGDSSQRPHRDSAPQRPEPAQEPQRCTSSRAKAGAAPGPASPRPWRWTWSRQRPPAQGG